jgi:lipoate-protein ligase A
LHDLGVPAAPVHRLVRVLEVDRPALVLGSTQPDADVAPGAGAEVDVVRRRSGGGAVLLEPGRTVWVDVVLPAGDPLWSDDVGRAFLWLGDAWAAALADLGVADLAVHRGGLVATAWSREICFAGLGPGEVTAGGRKVVGMSQRRTRDGALFQCALLLGRWDPSRIVALLAVPASAGGDLADAAWGVPDATAGDVVDALLAHLPA